MQRQVKKPVAIVILDGWGVAPPAKGNAVTRAKTPFFDHLLEKYPWATLQASGEAVGLPWHKMGNSEVGHMNIGSGRIMYQILPKIDHAIADGSFFENQAFLKTVNHVKQKNSKLHIMGLLSPGGVHSHSSHIYALIRLAKEQKLDQVFLHIFLDGRDSAKDAGLGYVQELQEQMQKIGIGKIATISGRFYAMDRNQRWQRIQKTYDAMVLGEGQITEDVERCMSESYNEGVFDEFIPPTVVVKNQKPIAKIEDGDGVIFVNYRRDRARHITEALTAPEFDKFSHTNQPKDIQMTSMSEYSPDFNVEVAFRSRKIKNPLGEVLSKNGLYQLRIAETEKYAHVTVFLNCGTIVPFEGEQRILVSSPHIETYDQKPEMSAHAVTDEVVKGLRQERYDFLCINYANPDMVGHTGNLKAAIKAVESVDRCLERVVEEVQKKNGTVIVTADHGNAEVMIDLQSGDADTEHTSFPVPFIVVSGNYKRKSQKAVTKEELYRHAPIGVLADIAPTILDMFDIKKPEEMTGISLLQTMLY